MQFGSSLEDGDEIQDKKGMKTFKTIKRKKMVIINDKQTMTKTHKVKLKLKVSKTKQQTSIKVKLKDKDNAITQASSQHVIFIHDINNYQRMKDGEGEDEKLYGLRLSYGYEDEHGLHFEVLAQPQGFKL